MIVNANLFQSQHNTLTSPKKITAFVGGIGSGKTYTGAHFVIKMTNLNRNCLGLIGANTYPQLRDSTLEGIFQEFDHLGLYYKYNKTNSILNFNGSKILCRSMDSYERLRGTELAWAYIDEVRDMQEQAHKVVLGRIRHKRAKDKRVLYTTTPCGFNWLKQYFAGKKKTDDYFMVNAKTRDNIYLDKGYIETLETSYDALLQKQELDGEFVNIHELPIYYSFDRIKHLNSFEYVKDFPIFIAMDFNVNPMTAICAQYYGNRLHVFKEIWIMTSNTKEMGEEIIRQFPKHMVTIIPDATGKALKTSSAGESDHTILKNMGLNVIDTSNPLRSDRYNAVNNCLYKNWVELDESCERLTEDLEEMDYKEGTDLEDNSNPLRGHLTACFGYLIWYFFPFSKPSRDNFTQTRIR